MGSSVQNAWGIWTRRCPVTWSTMPNIYKTCQKVLPSSQGRLGLVNIHYKAPFEETLLKKYENKAPVLE
jgi:hypothetical protein